MTVHNDRPLKAAVVGIGVMGWNHARVLAAMPETDLVAVVDSDPARRNTAIDAFGCLAFADIGDLAGLGIDFVVIAAPNDTHRRFAEAAFALGLHALVEKPIAPTIADARAIIAAADAAERLLMIGQVERFNPAVRAAKKACEGETIVSVQVTRVGPFPPRMSPVGVVIDLGVHDIDIIRTITGSEIVEIQAQLTSVRAEREDTALLQFRTASGALAHIATNWITPFKTRMLQIATTEKFIQADLMTRQVSEFFGYRPDGSYSMRQLPVAFAEPLREELTAFVTAIRTGGPSPVSGEDGLRNLEVALTCLEGRDPVALAAE